MRIDKLFLFIAIGFCFLMARYGEAVPKKTRFFVVSSYHREYL